MSRLDEHFVVIAGLLLAIMCAVQIGSIVQESPTNDEPLHLTAGYLYLTTGGNETIDDTPHPPLQTALAALPLLRMPLKPLTKEMVWGGQFLPWQNPMLADTIMLRARLVMIALTVLFGGWVAWWTRQHFGARVGLLAVTFFVFDPNLIAHGRYVTTDLMASFGVFLAATLWTSFLFAPSARTLALAAAGLGVALVSKFSAVFLLGVFPCLYCAIWFQKRGRPFFTNLGVLLVFLIMALGAGSIVAIAYAPTGLNAYLVGVRALGQFNTTGHPAYLLGRFSTSGWWYYFPVAFLVKTPTAALLACVIALLCVPLMLQRPLSGPKVIVLAVPAVVYFALAIFASINIGVRHILPIYAFLYVLLALTLIEYAPRLFGRAWPMALSALLLLLAAESLSIYPNYLSFFNWVSGGPANGSRYLLDSNIDWGQDTKKLARYAQDHRLAPLCTATFGSASTAYYGVPSRNLKLEARTADLVRNLSCFVAVSVNSLNGLYVSPEWFAPLRQREPLARIGYSIYVFDPPSGHLDRLE